MYQSQSLLNSIYRGVYIIPLVIAIHCTTLHKHGNPDHRVGDNNRGGGGGELGLGGRKSQDALFPVLYETLHAYIHVHTLWYVLVVVYFGLVVVATPLCTLTVVRGRVCIVSTYHSNQNSNLQILLE